MSSSQVWESTLNPLIPLQGLKVCQFRLSVSVLQMQTMARENVPKIWEKIISHSFGSFVSRPCTCCCAGKKYLKRSSGAIFCKLEENWSHWGRLSENWAGQLQLIVGNWPNCCRMKARKGEGGHVLTLLKLSAIYIYFHSLRHTDMQATNADRNLNKISFGSILLTPLANTYIAYTYNCVKSDV